MPDQPEPTDRLLDIPHSMLHKAQHNVKAYGAVGNGSNDDTTAINSAITAAAASGGSVFFPSPPAGGYYKVTSTIDISNKKGLHLLGGSSTNNALQGLQPPAVKILGPGASLDKLFKIQATGPSTSDGVVFENLEIANAVAPLWINSQAFFRAKNCTFAATNTGTADNAAVVLENCFWHWFEHCTFFAGTDGSNTWPAVIMRGRTTTVGWVETSALMHFRDCVFSQGGVKYELLNISGSQPSNFVFDNIVTEGLGTGQALFYFSNTSGTPQYVSQVMVRNYQSADGIGTNSIIRVNSSGGGLTGASLENCGYHSRIIQVEADTNVWYTTVKHCGDLPPVVNPDGSTGGSFRSVVQEAAGLPNLKLWGYYGDAPPKIEFRQGADITNLYANAAGSLWTDGNFRIGTDLYANHTDSGKIFFGSAGDTNLYRSAANVLKTDDAFEMTEQASDPAAPAANNGRLFFKDNGAGKTQLCVRFNTGDVQVLATEA